MGIRDEYPFRAKEIMLHFLRETFGKYEIKRKLLKTVNNGNLIGVDSLLVISLQRAQRKRKLAFNYRIAFVQYYWETMKVDMSKILLSYAKNLKAAKKVSVKVFAIENSTRDRFIEHYCEYCRQVFYYKFRIWRAFKLSAENKPLTFDVEEELDKIRSKVEYLEKFLFQNLDKFAQTVIMQNQKVEVKMILRTRLSVENIDWERDLRTVKIDGKDTALLLLNKPETPPEVKQIMIADQVPLFRFMPSKLQLMQMIIKAAYTKQ